MSETTLYGWINAEIERLGRFRSFWENARKETPEDFPDTMELGDWDEQYRCFADDLDGVATDD